MKIWLKLFLLLALLKTASGEELIAHNQILATVNGKAISVIDIMKKMETLFARAHPEYTKSNIHRYQFFCKSWRETLDQMIDSELIVADAEKLGIKISDAEIRQRLHQRFGPNIMTSLDALGLSLDEARHMIYTEIAVQRMSWYRVHSKALHQIGPQEIKEKYKSYLAQTPLKEEWKYQVLSIQSPTDPLAGQTVAQKAQTLIDNQHFPLETLASKLKEENPKVTITLSEELKVEESKLSQSHKTALRTLEPNTYSAPLPQISRREKKVVHRIFYLKEHKTIPPQSFNSMIDTLENQLITREVKREFPLYLKKLRRSFHCQSKTLPSDPPPFELR